MNINNKGWSAVNCPSRGTHHSSTCMRSNLESTISLMEKWGTWRKPVQTPGEHVNSTQKSSKLKANPQNGVVLFYPKRSQCFDWHVKSLSPFKHTTSKQNKRRNRNIFRHMHVLSESSQLAQNETLALTQNSHNTHTVGLSIQTHCRTL